MNLSDVAGDIMGHTKFSDASINAFKKTNLHYTDNKLLKYQDPTYLGFKLMFIFDQPESGLLSEVSHPNTALGYLLRRGENDRAEYLIRFVRLLKRINSECPWFWQQLDGLGDAWKHGFNDETFKAALPNDRKLTISTLDESIDLRMTALMDLYRKACFDWQNRREVVPKNLRYFSVSIYCYESRTINRRGDSGGPLKLASKILESSLPLKSTALKNKDEMDLFLGPDPAELDITKKDYVNDKISRVLFNFSYCEWMPDESGVIVDALSSKSNELKAQKLVFSYKNVYEDNVYRMFHDKTVTDAFIGTLDGLSLDNPINLPGGVSINGPENPSFGSLTINAAKGIAQQALDTAMSEATDYATAKMNKFLLGNVYGFSPLGIVNTILDPQAAVQAAIGIIETPRKNSSLKNIDHKAQGNVYGR